MATKASRIFTWHDLPTSDLIVDAIYKGGKQGHGKANEVINRLLPGMPNSSGFRYAGSFETTPVVVLYTTSNEPSWPDELDPYRGTFIYYGDNRHPGKELHKTQRKGNEILRRAFEAAHSGSEEGRGRCPIFLIFEKSGTGFDVKFLGMAVPGTRNLSSDEDLTAIWRVENGQRFQNYRAVFTVLDPGSDDKHVDGNWIREAIKAQQINFTDASAPTSLKHWVKTGFYKPLVSQQLPTGRTIAQQLPDSKIEQTLVESIYQYCQDDPYRFEEVAAEFWRIHCVERTQIDNTRPYRDGGRDGTGWIGIGPQDDVVKLHFSMEAKCYAQSRGVTVKDVSRLISRLRHREFGVLITTSYLSEQAYAEIRADEHPIVVFSGRDIARTLYTHGITTRDDCLAWLRSIPTREEFHGRQSNRSKTRTAIAAVQ